MSSVPHRTDGTVHMRNQLRFCPRPVLPTTTPLRNRRLSQARFPRGLRVSSLTIATRLCGECESFGLAIQITETPRIKERSGAASRREIIELTPSDAVRYP
jgi:hypothetical protein